MKIWSLILFFFYRHPVLADHVEAAIATLNNSVFLEHPIQNLIRPYLDFVDGAFRYLQEEPEVLNSTKSCRNDTRLLLDLAREGNEDALKFLDATGKPLSGFLEGGFSFLGFYSECLNSHIQNSSDDVNIFGKYCLVQLDVSRSKSSSVISRASWTVFVQSHKNPAIGICVPFSCSDTDIHLAVNKSLSEQLYTDVIDTTSCYKETEFTKDSTAIGITFLYLLFIAIAISATAYHVLHSYYNSCQDDSIDPSSEAICESSDPGSIQEEPTYDVYKQCLLSFSLKANISRLISVESGGGAQNIGCLHGIRFLTMMLIILLHTYSFAMQDLFFRNSEVMLQVPTHFLSQIFTNGTLAVDTFYFMSGLLVAYVALKGMAQRGSLGVFYFYIHRIIRLSPLLLMVIAFCVGILRYTGSGPNWPFSIMMYDQWCRKNWWLTFLYLQNFIDTDNMCLSHSWYLATDFQFYILTPPIIILLFKRFLYGAVLIGIYFIINVVSTVTLTVLNNYPAVPYMSNVVPQDIVNNYYKEVYIKPYCRMGPYLVGVLAGYLFANKTEMHLKKIHVSLAWMASSFLILFTIFIMYGANNGHLPSVAAAATYSALARTVWALGVAWLVFACVYGYGGFINKFLSWKVLVPFSRLTYCAYLIHPVVIAVYNGGIEMEVDFSYINMFYIFSGNLICTYVLSLGLTLLFESPFIALERVFLKRG